MRASQKKMDQNLAKMSQMLSGTAKKLHNRSREATRAKNSRNIARAEVRKLKHALKMRRGRAPGQKEQAIRKALERACTTPTDVYLKEKGIVKDSARDMVRTMLTNNVAAERVNTLVKSVTDFLGMTLRDGISARSAGRIMKEGGVASELQLVHEIETARGKFKSIFILNDTHRSTF